LKEALFMFYKIKSVEPLDNYILLITFENGIVKKYDVKKLFEKWENFNDLKNIIGLFSNVKVDSGGYGVYWNENIDLSCNELWNDGKEII